MATALHGKNGVVFWNGTAVALVTNWNLNIGPTKEDITAMDSGGWGQTMAGIFKATGSIVIENNSDDTIMANMRASVLAGTLKILRLYENGTAGNYYSGSALLDMALNAPVAAKEEATYNFESHGPWSYT